MTRSQGGAERAVAEGPRPLARLPILGGIQERAARLATSRYVPAVTLLILLKIAVSGLGTIPREPYRLAALDPFHRVTAHPENYFQRSPLLPLLGYFSGLTSPSGFGALCLTIVTIGLMAYALMARRRHGAQDGLLQFGLVVSHPVTLVLLSWLGTPDGLSFLFATVLLFSNSLPLIGLASALGAFNHPVIHFVAPVVIILRLAAREPGLKNRSLGAVALGLLLGNAAVLAFLDAFGIETFSRLDFLMDRSLLTWVKQNTFALPHTLYSLHQASWFALALCVGVLFNRDRRYYLMFAASQLLFFVVTFFSADTTRVFSLLAWAPALHCIQHSLSLVDQTEGAASREVFRQVLILVAIVGLLTPGYYIWTGELHLPNFNGFYNPILGGLLRLIGR